MTEQFTSIPEFRQMEIRIRALDFEVSRQNDMLMAYVHELQNALNYYSMHSPEYKAIDKILSVAREGQRESHVRWNRKQVDLQSQCQHPNKSAFREDYSGEDFESCPDCGWADAV